MNAVISPVNHVRRGVTHPIEHLKTKGIIFVVTVVKIDGITNHHRSRVGGELRLDDGVVRMADRSHCRGDDCRQH